MKTIKTTLALLGLAFASIAQAACFPPTTTSNAIRVTKRLADDSGFIACDLLKPASNVDGLFRYNALNSEPDFVTLGTGLSIANGVLSATGASSVAWNDITGKPTFSAVSTTGSYNDLLTKPTIPAAQVNSDWNSVSGVSQILNKPALAAVATTGSYTDLTNKPALFNGQYSSLTGIPATFAPSAHTQAWSTITGTPTTLSGYGITDAYPLSGNPSGFLTGITSTQVTSALGFTPYNATNPSGFVSQSGARSAISLTTTGNSGPATYNSTTGVLNVPQYAVTGGGVTSITAGTGLSGGTITSTGTISMPNTGTAGTYSGVTTDAQGRVTSGTNRSFSYLTRALNTCFQVSSTRDALVTYSVDINTSLSLTAGQQGTVYLRVYTNNTCTTGAQEVTRFANGNTGTLTVGLSLSQTVTGTLNGVIPAGSYVQLVTENNTGTPTFTARPGQEVLM